MLAIPLVVSMIAFMSWWCITTGSKLDPCISMKYLLQRMFSNALSIQYPGGHTKWKQWGQQLSSNTIMLVLYFVSTKELTHFILLQGDQLQNVCPRLLLHFSSWHRNCFSCPHGKHINSWLPALRKQYGTFLCHHRDCCDKCNIAEIAGVLQRALQCLIYCMWLLQCCIYCMGLLWHCRDCKT